MKNQKICPKCGGADILIIDGYAGAYGTGNHIITGRSVFSAVNVDRYICCTCGYTEEWISVEGIEKIKKSKRAHR